MSVPRYVCGVFLFAFFLMSGCGLPNPGQDGATAHDSQCGDATGLSGEGSLCVAPVDAISPAGMMEGRVAITEEKAASEEEADSQDPGEEVLNTALEFYKASQDYWSEGNLENAIGALDQAYALILQVSAEEQAGLVQQKEDLRFMVSKRILEIYASRHTATNGSHKAIPLTLNEHVEKEIRRFQGVEREFFLQSYARSGRYRREILRALKEAGLPEEISWLPLIESGFKVKALSRARALGLWQFIPSTGYKFGLSRDTWVDERLDPEKSTAAAIAYLKELHQIFGDWMTVLAAYNCGEGTVLRVIRSQRVNYLDNFWDLYERLPRETSRYVPRFLAVLHILKNPVAHGFSLGDAESPLPRETVTVNKSVRLKDLAKKLGLDAEELIALNPELRLKATPKESYDLKVPPGTGETLLAAVDELPEWSPPKRRYAYHRVRRGETLSLIALRYRTTISAIARANNIRRNGIIRAGKVLKIPQRGAYRSSARYKLSSDGTYRVRRGDSLWLLARRFGTSMGKIKKMNNLNTTQLYVGQVLTIR